MALALVAGPANAGKVASLLDRYLTTLDQDPFLVVPNRAEVEAVERDLLTRAPVLLGGSIGTFDDLFQAVFHKAGIDTPQVLSQLQRRLLLAEVARTAEPDKRGPRTSPSGFVDALGETVSELESSLVEPGDIEGELGRLFQSCRAELARLGVWDVAHARRRAAELAANDLAAWDGTPVFAYGFEDLTGAQWLLLEALAARAEVVVSLPYEPGRAVFAALQGTAEDLTRLADRAVEELPPQGSYDSPALAFLERALFEDSRTEPPPLDGAVRFLEAAGSRGALELAGEDILELLRGGTPGEEIGVIVPSIERWRAPLEAAFRALEIPFAVEAPIPFRRTTLGRALLGLLRFAWLDGGRRELFAFLRSPYSGLPRHRADFVEGRLRGRATSEPARVEAETVHLLGHGLPALDAVREADSPLAGVRAALSLMIKNAYGLEAPPVGDQARLDLRAHEKALEAIADLDGWQALVRPAAAEAIVSALERESVRTDRPREVSRVAVLDLLRARTRRFAAVFLFGLEEGELPRRGNDASLLTDEQRAKLQETGNGRRLTQAEPLAFDRYLFYTACTRAWKRLTLVREAATDDGRPREPSPFWDEVRSCFGSGDVVRSTRRRPLAALTWDLERAPTERERLRTTAALGSTDADLARALGRANGWERRVERALAAFSRPTTLANAAVLGRLRERTRFAVTELEQFGDCSSMWLFEKVISPKEIEGEVDARLRGSVAHQALSRFYAEVPKRLGVDRPDSSCIEEALSLLQECLATAIEGRTARLELSDVERIELEGSLGRDLEQFVRQEIALELPLVPRQFEVSFGSERAPAELRRGLDLGEFTVSGKIDRIDVDPFSARGIVQDYKLGLAHSAKQIESDRRLQIPLYILALRDLLGMEPLGGLYRGLSGRRETRGLLRADFEDAVPGLARNDYLDEDTFWRQIEQARERSTQAVERIKGGDVQHDPRWGSCPTWCELWSMCRVKRS